MASGHNLSSFSSFFLTHLFPLREYHFQFVSKLIRRYAHGFFRSLKDVWNRFDHLFSTCNIYNLVSLTQIVRVFNNWNKSASIPSFFSFLFEYLSIYLIFLRTSGHIYLYTLSNYLNLRTKKRKKRYNSRPIPILRTHLSKNTVLVHLFPVKDSRMPRLVISSNP